MVTAGEERKGLGSLCERCGSKMETTGDERSEPLAGIGPDTDEQIVYHEYVCRNPKCGLHEWVAVGKA